jgi:hypothetical protein
MQLVQIRRVVPLAVLVAALVLAGTSARSPVASALDGPKPQAPPPVDQCGLADDDDFGKGYNANERKAFANERAAQRWLRKHPRARKALAGRWFSVSSRHGAYHLAFTRNAVAYERSLRKAVPHPDRMCVSPALYTLRELNAAQRRIERDWDWLNRRGVVLTSLGVNEQTGTLDIGLHYSSKGDATQVLRRRYGGQAGLRVEFSEFAQFVDGADLQTG